MAITLSSELVPAVEAAQSAAPARPVARVVQGHALQQPVEPDPQMKIAFVTTCVPGKEPAEMVRATLAAAVSMRHPVPYDVWLLDATTVYNVNAGGFYIGTVGAGFPAANSITWVGRNAGGIDTTQLYSIGQDSSSLYQVHGGLQDPSGRGLVELRAHSCRTDLRQSAGDRAEGEAQGAERDRKPEVEEPKR